MKEDVAIDKSQEESDEKLICIWLGINHMLWKEWPHFCTLQAIKMIFLFPEFKLSDRQDAIKGNILGS